LLLDGNILSNVKAVQEKSSQLRINLCYDRQMIEEIPIGAEWKLLRCVNCKYEFFSKDIPELCPRNTCRRVAQPKAYAGAHSPVRTQSNTLEVQEPSQ
jgi:hypothetical protein